MLNRLVTLKSVADFSKKLTVVSGCGKPQWAKDEHCDDENNNAECNFDGGACCSDKDQLYCTICQCKSELNCAIPEWAKDEYCDDENNTPHCNFDNGACCSGNFEYCNFCECKQND